jgi:hypothetical protein
MSSPGLSRTLLILVATAVVAVVVKDTAYTEQPKSEERKTASKQARGGGGEWMTSGGGGGGVEEREGGRRRRPCLSRRVRNKTKQRAYRLQLLKLKFTEFASAINLRGPVPLLLVSRCPTEDCTFLHQHLQD